MDVALSRDCGLPVRLHLGAGYKLLPGYTAIDVMPETNPDVVADATDLHMYAADSVDTIYACHLLEHFTIPETRIALCEWKRILIPQYGTLRLALPDFGQIIRLYQDHGVHLERLRGMLYGGQTNHYDYHLSTWDYETLACMLRRCGYFGIKRWSCYDPDVLPQPPEYWDYSMIEINGYSCSLNVEARPK